MEEIKRLSTCPNLDPPDDWIAIVLANFRDDDYKLGPLLTSITNNTFKKTNQSSVVTLIERYQTLLRQYILNLKDDNMDLKKSLCKAIATLEEAL